MKHIKYIFEDSRMLPGECVGLQAAQALAEPLMQMTLNSAHTMGSARGSGGVMTRLISLLNATADDLLYQNSCYGLPSLRPFLIREIGKLYKDSGENIDVRHLRLVADFMLRDGEVQGFLRQDISEGSSFIKVAAFEEPVAAM